MDKVSDHKINLSKMTFIHKRDLEGGEEVLGMGGRLERACVESNQNKSYQKISLSLVNNAIHLY